MPGRIAAAAGLVEEPDAPLGLVDIDLEQACGGDVVVLLAHVVASRIAATKR